MKKSKNHFNEKKWSWYVQLKGYDIQLAFANKFTASDLFVMMKLMNFLSTNSQGKCWATNDFFAELFNLSERSVSSTISKMCDCGMIVSIVHRNKLGTWRMMYLPEAFEMEFQGKQKHQVTEKLFFEKNADIFMYEKEIQY